MEDNEDRNKDKTDYVNSAEVVESILRLALKECAAVHYGPNTSKCQNITYTSCPGRITKFLPKAGISKSEHAINNIAYDADFVNSLKLTSQSFKTNENELPGTANRKPSDNCIVDVQNIIISCIQTDKVYETNSNVSTHPLMENALQEHEAIVATDKAKVTKIVTPKRSTQKKSDSVMAVTIQRDSLSSIDSNVCRICMTRGRERLISPCHCKGSLANVHLSCLERWLNQVGRNHCELCGYSYPAIRTPRYTIVQALRLWFGNPRNRSHLQSDCLIFWLLSTVTAGLLAVCIVGTQYFVMEGNKFGISHRITETAMDFFMAIVLCGYTVTVYLLWKDHYVMWNRWRRANVNVRLLLPPDNNSISFVSRRQSNV